MAVEIIYRVTTRKGEVHDYMDKREADYEDARLEVMYGLSDLLAETSKEALDQALTQDDCDKLAEVLLAKPDSILGLIKSLPKKRKTPGRKPAADPTESNDNPGKDINDTDAQQSVGASEEQLELDQAVA